MNLDRWFHGIPKRQQRLAAWGVAIGTPLLLAGGIAAAVAGGDDDEAAERRDQTTTSSDRETIRERTATSGQSTTSTTEPPTSSSSTTTTTVRQATTTSAISTTTVRESPVPRSCTDYSADNPGRFTTSPREVCELERSICADFGVAQVADEYGGDPASPLDVAITMAEETYQLAFQASAAQGCIWVSKTGVSTREP